MSANKFLLIILVCVGVPTLALGTLIVYLSKDVAKCKEQIELGGVSYDFKSDCDIITLKVDFNAEATKYSVLSKNDGLKCHCVDMDNSLRMIEESLKCK